ncbi:MAG: NYN domain-containing protein [Fibrobacter sp.]|nr:NYN domain-containing protein [Fibrobacter sp.]
MPENALRVGFFLDGYTLKKVNEYYRVHHRFHSNIDFRGLKSWVQMQAYKFFDPESGYIEMESHYYHPYRNPHIYGRSVEGVLKLEHELRSAGFQVHYSDHEEETGLLGPNMGLMEDALLFASYKKMDAVVLLSTQGQFAPLPDRLRMMGIPTMLLGWNFIYPKKNHTVRWKTDTCLRRTCAHYVAMEKVMDASPDTDEPPRGFFFQSEHPFSRGRPALWMDRAAAEMQNPQRMRA